MLTNDDLSKYGSVDSYLESLRSKNNGGRSEQPQSNAGTSNFSDTLRDTIRGSTHSNREASTDGRRTDETVYRPDGSSESATRSTGSFAEQLRHVDHVVTRDNSRTNQYQRPATEANRKSKWSGIGNVYQRYREALKGDKVVDADKPAAKKKTTSSKLTDTEVIKLRPKLIEYFVWQTEHFDQFIIATTVGHDDSIVIWADLSYDEIEIIVDYLLSRGKTDARTATAVRYASVMLDRVKLGLIVLPRMYKTFMIYMTRGFSIKLIP